MKPLSTGQSLDVHGTLQTTVRPEIGTASECRQPDPVHFKVCDPAAHTKLWRAMRVVYSAVVCAVVQVTEAGVRLFPVGDGRV